MPNARDAHALTKKKLLLLGDTGSGKTTQFLTLPGKKFIYLFDPNAILSLQGYDIDYEELMPTTVSAAVSSLSKGKGSDHRSTTTSDVYSRFEREFDERLASGFFDQYDWIGFDSATTLLDLIMDRVLTINGRFGQWPNQDDYGPSMIAFINLCRTVTGMDKGLFMTGHVEVKQDQVTQKITNRPMMTGRLVGKIPLLFSEIFYTDSALDDKGHVNYRIQTVPDGINRVIRTSIRGLEPYEDVTIDFTKDPVEQGIGGILAWAEQQRK
jgi:hypothetical protein